MESRWRRAWTSARTASTEEVLQTTFVGNMLTGIDFPSVTLRPHTHLSYTGIILIPTEFKSLGASNTLTFTLHSHHYGFQRVV